MKHLGLFEGIGGFSLAARWMGWETVAWCEWNEFCQKVLRYHFPEAEGFGDITKTDFKKYANTIDVLTGGFPCQPYSQAGKRKGKADDRHLWPEMLRAIREVQPRWIVGENVSGLLNWNRGMVLDEIKADLEAAGFEVIPPLVLPACGKDAPHRRDRVWIVAHSKRIGLQSQGQSINAIGATENKNRETSWTKLLFQGQSLPHLFSHDDGISERLDNITISDWRDESNKAYGNAIVPQIAYQIFKTIEQYENQKSKS